MNYLEPDQPRHHARPSRPACRVLRRRKIIVKHSAEKRETQRGTWTRTRKIKRIIEVEKRFEPAVHRPLQGESRTQWLTGSVESMPLPQRVKLSVRGTSRPEGQSDATLDGDYILETVYSDAQSRRWEHVFPARYGYFRIVVTATPSARGEIVFSAGFEGKQPGVRWAARCARLSRFITLRLKKAPSEPVRWPETVELTLLGSDYPAMTACFGSAAP